MKLYTFNVSCSFNMQYTFTEQEIQPDAEGNDDDVEPTAKAQRELENRLTEYLGQNFSLIDNVEAFANSDALLGVMDDPEL